MINEYLNRRVIGKLDRVLMVPDEHRTYQVPREEGMRFFMNAADPLCISGFDGRFAHVNPAWESLLGWPAEKIRGLHRLNFVHSEDHERTIAAEQRLLKGETLREFENRYQCKNGTVKWLSWNSVPDVRRREIFSVARDITGQQRARMERESQIGKFKEALRKMKVLQGILTVCSHCRRIRDEDRWEDMETYIENHTEAAFSHGICPDCMKQLYPSL